MKTEVPGELSGHGLSRENVVIEMEEVRNADFSISHYCCRLPWSGSHQFAVNSSYELTLKEGQFYKARVVEVKPGLVKFETHT